MPATTVPVTASCLVEKLRRIADCENGNAVQIMPPPSYLRALLYEDTGDSESAIGLTPDIILVYKANIKTSTSSLPLDVRDEANHSMDSSMELEGNPLPAPFSENDEFDVSVAERKEFNWPKGELNHFPLRIVDAQSILDFDDDFEDDTSMSLDVWCLVNGGVKNESLECEAQNNSLNGNQSINGSMSMIVGDDLSTSISNASNERVRVLLGVHATGSWFTRSFVESVGICSIESPVMDPIKMKDGHLEIASLQDHKLSVDVLCRFNILGQYISPDVPLSEEAASVSLEMRWRQPTLSVPHQEASAKVIVQAAVGKKSSRANDLWKQVCVLHKLFELLLNCWRDKTSPEALPHLDPAPEDVDDDQAKVESLESRIETLIMGGQQALQAQNANRRMSIAPSLMGRQSIAPSVNSRQSIAPNANRRQSMAPGFLGRRSIAPQAIQKETTEEEIKTLSLSEALDIVVAGNRENSDMIDGLYSLLIECKTYHELMSAWDLTFIGLSKGKRPHIRPKNNTRAAKLIQSFVAGQSDCPDFLHMDSSLLGVELLIEMGLEKLTSDYRYIFLDSHLVSRDLLQPPQMVRGGLGVPRDTWLASCGQLLGWLAQVHCGLEIALPLLESMPNNSTPYIAAEALKFYQSEESPVRSVAGLLTPGNALQEFSWNVKIDSVIQNITGQFDWWRMTLTSENKYRKVRSVFLRSYLRPIFPPQLCDNSEMLTDQYHCADAVTISEKF